MVDIGGIPTYDSGDVFHMNNRRLPTHTVEDEVTLINDQGEEATQPPTKDHTSILTMLDGNLASVATADARRCQLVTDMPELFTWLAQQPQATVYVAGRDSYFTCTLLGTAADSAGDAT